MKGLNELLQELGISKVRLAKYLNVSRQMVYNYLELEDINRWPKEKKILLLKLLDINDASNDAFNKIKITTDYLMAVENRLNQSLRDDKNENYFDFNGLGKEEQNLILDIVSLLKNILINDTKKTKKSLHTVNYLYHTLQSLDNMPEINYILSYISKYEGFTSPDEYPFEAEQQFIFEGILYTALTLYYKGGASKSRLTGIHKKFINEIEKKREEKLSRTEQLSSIRLQALKELGYDELNDYNAKEVIEKIAEIETRKA